MSYFVVCTFDLKSATSLDYQNAYADLATVGLYTQLAGSNGNKIALPSTTTAGTFNGSSAAQVRDDVAESVKQAFAARGFDSSIFVAVGGDWAWAHRTT